MYLLTLWELSSKQLESINDYFLNKTNAQLNWFLCVCWGEHYFLVWQSVYKYILSNMIIFLISFLLIIFPLFFVNRNKKKKIPLMNGEEVDMDLSAME